MKILLLEDESLVREGMRALIGYAVTGAVVFEASTFEEATKILIQEKIEVAFLDYELKFKKGPDLERNGLDVLHFIHENELEVKAIMLSGRSERDVVFGCLNAGAAGYIPKNSDNNQLFERAIKSVFAGEVFLPSDVLSNSRQASSVDRPQGSGLCPGKIPDGLSRRMIEVLYHVCQGLPNKTIAAKMGIEEGTVRRDYMPKVFRAFGVSRRTELMVEIARRGIVVSPPAMQSSGDSAEQSG